MEHVKNQLFSQEQTKRLLEIRSFYNVMSLLAFCQNVRITLNALDQGINYLTYLKSELNRMNSVRVAMIGSDLLFLKSLRDDLSRRL